MPARAPLRDSPYRHQTCITFDAFASKKLFKILLFMQYSIAVLSASSNGMPSFWYVLTLAINVAYPSSVSLLSTPRGQSKVRAAEMDGKRQNLSERSGRRFWAVGKEGR
jgi:hypothetical protein